VRRSAEERIEDAIDMLGLNAGPCIADVEMHLASFGRSGDADCRARRRVLGRVVQQLCDRMLQQEGIDTDHREIGGQIRLDHVRCELLLRSSERGLDHVGDLVQLEAGRDLPGPDAGEVEDVADEGVEAFRLLADGCNEFVTRLRVLTVTEGLQGGRRAEDGCKRRLQIVRNRVYQGLSELLGFGLDARTLAPPNLFGKAAIKAGKGAYGVDQSVVDGAVNGSGRTADYLGRGLRLLQNGNVQAYATLMFIGGVVALAVVFSAR